MFQNIPEYSTITYVKFEIVRDNLWSDNYKNEQSRTRVCGRVLDFEFEFDIESSDSTSKCDAKFEIVRDNLWSNNYKDEQCDAFC